MSGYKVLREMTYDGVQYVPGDVISQDAIESAAPGKEKEGKLLRTRFIASDSFERDPQMMTKNELVDFGRTVDARFESNWRKADIIEAIEAKL